MWFFSLAVLWVCCVRRNVLVTFVRQSADYYYYIIRPLILTWLWLCKHYPWCGL